jgi:hypothetical protein
VASRKYPIGDSVTIERERLLDDIARCFARAAVDALLADPEKNAADPKRERRLKDSTRRSKRHGHSTALPDTSAT